MTNPHSIPHTDITRLFAQYDGFLLDAFGVLVDKQGALPGAVALIERLNAEGRPYLVLTNSASRLPETMSGDFGDSGLRIPPQRILSSGALLTDHFQRQRLEGKRCLVLGPEGAFRYVELAGGVTLPMEHSFAAEMAVVADQQGFDCLEAMNRLLSIALQKFDHGEPFPLILCNPDLIYPVAPGRYGFTAGGLATLLESALKQRYGANTPRFERLGKPHRPIFDAAVARLGARRPVMIGDQLATDILGANKAGIDSVLVGTGLSPGLAGIGDIRPKWFLSGLA